MIFSNMLLVFMISMQTGMYGLMINNSLEALTGHLQIQAPGYIDDQKMRQIVPDAISLAASLRATLRDDLESSNVAVRAAAFALVSSEDRSYGIQLLGVEPQFEPAVSSLPGLTRQGRYLNDVSAAEIVIGSVLARNLQVRLGDELTILGSAYDGSIAAGIVNIVGIFEGGSTDLDRGIAEVPIAYFQDTFDMGGAAHQIVINTGDYSRADAVMQQVKAVLPANSKLAVHDWNALQPGLKQAIQADIGGAVFMYGILVILVAFSVLNTQLMSVLERTREFGIIMSLGLTPGRLGRLVMLEATLMGLLGLIGGAVVGGLIVAATSQSGIYIPGMEEMAGQFNLPSRLYPRLSLFSMLIGPSVVFVFTLLATIYPAIRLQWLEPVQAMRAA
jgi:ABC-type lipoprotein release transport system permease subunit